MKKGITFFICIISLLSYSCQNYTKNASLDFYLQYGAYTEPGKYEYLFKNLPDSIPLLCNLIKSQIIHPYSELPDYWE